MYESRVSFTFDIACPWLDKALAEVRAASLAVTFTIHFEPHQLSPRFPESTDKRTWHLEHKHNDNPVTQETYQAHMRSLGDPEGISYRFCGLTGNTLQAHRIIQYFQGAKGATTANRLVDALYRRFFEENKYPASDETLLEACIKAGIEKAEAEEVIGDKEKGLKSAKGRSRFVSMDVEAVPIVCFEGKRRDVTLTAANEANAYVKALETVTKESV